MNEAGHRLPGEVPGHVVQQCVGSALARRSVFGERGLHRVHELPGGVRDARESQLAVRAHDVADGRGDHGATRSQVFRRFRRTDEARGLVPGKWQERDVPPAEVIGQRFVRLRSEIVNVCGTRQRCRVDLDHRADHDEVPVGPQLRGAGDQIAIEPLVDHPVESESRPPDSLLIFGFLEIGPPRAREVRHIDAARKGVDVRMQVPLGLVQAASSREDHIRGGQQRPFGAAQFGGRAGEP